MKASFLLLLVAGLAHWLCSPVLSSLDFSLNEQQLKTLADLKLRSLPNEYQQALLEVRAISASERDQESTWCCKNGNPIAMKVITTTFIKWEPTGQTQQVVAGYDSCGFGGWSTCTRYAMQQVPTSYIDYGHEIVPDVENSHCPDNHIVCCKGMIPVVGFCMRIEEFKKVIAQWAVLQASHPTAILEDLIVTLQNNGLNTSGK